MKRSWHVTARSVMRESGADVPLADGSGFERTELVHSDNPIFAGCETILDVHDAYEAFWNHINDSSEHLVWVTGVKEVA